jgi:hypothetical protein
VANDHAFSGGAQAPSAATRGYPATRCTSEYTLEMQPLLGAAALAFLAVAGEKPDRTGPIVECSPALKGHWTTVRDHRKALAFVADARRAGELTEGGPVDCGLEIVTMCGEDLNGDGASEILVRAHWEVRFPEDADGLKPLAENERCHRKPYGGGSNPYTSLYLIASTKRLPAGKVILIADETGAGNQGPNDATFTTWRGRPAVRLVLEHMESDTGVVRHLERILSLRSESPVTLHEAKLSPGY